MLSSIAKATGKGIKIAVVDDGVCADHPMLRNLVSEVNLQTEFKDSIRPEKRSLSHGTICGCLISSRAPDSLIYSVKVLNEKGDGNPSSLVKALNWAIENEIDIVNLSLGTTSAIYLDDIRNACIEAVRNKVVLVSATNNAGLASYPSALPEVIAVGKDDRYSEYQYGYYPGRLAEFVAAGADTQTANIIDTYKITNGTFSIQSCTSFAAPRIAAIIAAILEHSPDLDIAQIKDCLVAGETRLKARAFSISKLQSPADQDLNLNMQAEPEAGNMKNVVLFPNNNTTNDILANIDLFPFKINAVIDPVHASAIGKDAGFLHGLNNLHIPVLENLGKSEGGTLLLGDLNELIAGQRKDILNEMLVQALERNMDVYSLFPIHEHLHKNIFDRAESSRISFDSVAAHINKLLHLDPQSVEFEIDVPVIGFFGTSFNQGKLMGQLALSRSLKAQGYEVSIVGTNPVSALLPNAVYVPQDSRCIQHIPGHHQIPYIQMAMAKAFQSRPHLIIAGAQGGTLPPKLYNVHASSHKHFPQNYTLTSLGFLMATKPDAVVLSINTTDDDDLILRTIRTIETLSAAKVICLSISNKLVYEAQYSYKQRSGRSLSADEITTLKSHLQNKFGLLVICPFIQQDQIELTNMVANSFEVISN